MMYCGFEKQEISFVWPYNEECEYLTTRGNEIPDHIEIQLINLVIF